MGISLAFILMCSASYLITDLRLVRGKACQLSALLPLVTLLACLAQLAWNICSKFDSFVMAWQALSALSSAPGDLKSKQPISLEHARRNDEHAGFHKRPRGPVIASSGRHSRASNCAPLQDWWTGTRWRTLTQCSGRWSCCTSFGRCRLYAGVESEHTISWGAQGCAVLGGVALPGKLCQGSSPIHDPYFGEVLATSCGDKKEKGCVVAAGERSADVLMRACIQEPVG
eukprot:scaffold60441_cov17-Tisochrysis_lutea.AAC.1